MLDRVGYSPIRDPIHYGTKRDKFRQFVTTLQILTRKERGQGARKARQVPLCAWYMRPVYHG